MMRRTLSHFLPLVCAVLCSAVVVPFPPSTAAPPESDAPAAKPAAEPVKANTSGIEYNRDIRPILAENCFACHGPDSADAQGRIADRPARRGDGDEGDRPGQAGRERDDSSNPDGRFARPDAARQVEQKTQARAKGVAQEVGRVRGRVPAPLVVHHPDPTRRPRGEGQVVGAKPHRQLRAGAAGSRGAEARAGSRSPHARTPARVRPHGVAAGAGGRRSVRERQVRRVVRDLRREAAGTAAVGRTPGPVLARLRPLRRHPRHPHRQLPRDLGLPRRSHQGVQYQPAVRPVHDRATGRRPAAEPDARPARRHRLQPLQHHHQRGRRDQRGVPRPLCPRPHRDDLPGVDGPDHRLRGLPRPQVRPGLAKGLLLALRVLQQHHAGGDGRERAEHAADHPRAQGRRPPAVRRDRQGTGRDVREAHVAENRGEAGVREVAEDRQRRERVRQEPARGSAAPRPAHRRHRQ